MDQGTTNRTELFHEKVSTLQGPPPKATRIRCLGGTVHTWAERWRSWAPSILSDREPALETMQISRAVRSEALAP
jgi:hypothetical protein